MVIKYISVRTKKIKNIGQWKKTQIKVFDYRVMNDLTLHYKQ